MEPELKMTRPSQGSWEPPNLSTGSLWPLPDKVGGAEILHVHKDRSRERFPTGGGGTEITKRSPCIAWPLPDHPDRHFPHQLPSYIWQVSWVTRPLPYLKCYRSETILKPTFFWFINLNQVVTNILNYNKNALIFAKNQIRLLLINSFIVFDKQQVIQFLWMTCFRYYLLFKHLQKKQNLLRKIHFCSSLRGPGSQNTCEAQTQKPPMAGTLLIPNYVFQNLDTTSLITNFLKD